MMISTKGRYALRIMIDLAQNSRGEFISLKDIGNRQDISLKYLESIVAILNKGGLLVSMRGKDGGYMLKKDAQDISIYEIVSLTEGGLAPVACLEQSADCGRKAECLTHPLWSELDLVVKKYLQSISLADVIMGNVKR